MKSEIIELNVTRDVFGLQIAARPLDSEVEAKYVDANSFNNLSIKLLMGLFNGVWWGFLRGYPTANRINTYITPGYALGNNSPPDDTDDFYYWETITNVITSTPMKIVSPPISDNYPYIRTGSRVHIMNVSGPVSANGFWEIGAVNTTSDTVELVGSVGAATAFANTVATPKALALFHFDVSSPTSSNIPGGITYCNQNGPDGNTFGTPEIWVGQSSVATNKTHIGCWHFINKGAHTGALSYGGTLVSEPAVALATSTITITQQFTNNDPSNRDIEIKEASLGCTGYYGYPTSTYMKVWIARDLVTITVLNGATVEISYRFNTHSTPTGGFLRQFNELLYRHLGQTSREAKTIYNQNVTTSEASSTFRVVTGTGGYAGPASSVFDESGYPWPWEFGLVVGTSTLAVDFEDYQLGSKITHGVATDQLYYHGTGVDFLTENTTTCSFDVYRLFENLSASTVTIKEMGLYTCLGYSDTNIHCIARHILTTPFSIPPGEIGKLTYRISS